MSEAGQPSSRKWRPDKRFRMISTGVLLIAAIGLVVNELPSRGVDARSLQKSAPLPPSVQAGGEQYQRKPEAASPYEYLIDPSQDPAGHAEQRRANSIRQNLAQAKAQLEAKNHDDAIRALNRVMMLQPDNAEAHAQMGLALIGRGQYDVASDFLLRAIDLDPYQANAYFGIAMVEESAGNLEGAIGGMRNFLHVTDDPDPGRLQVAQARSAIWEWEAKLGRGPWGPTRGIPPDFTEAELKRDGKGVGMKMPVGKLEADKPMRYEIKAGEPVQVFDR